MLLHTLTVILFSIVNKQDQCLSAAEWVKKAWHTHSVAQNQAIERNGAVHVTRLGFKRCPLKEASCKRHVSCNPIYVKYLEQAKVTRQKVDPMVSRGWEIGGQRNGSHGACLRVF